MGYYKPLFPAVQELWHTLPRQCFYCSRRLSVKSRTVDHLVPISRGGTDDTCNLVLCCRPCNQAKGDLLPAEFTRLCEFYGGVEIIRQKYGADPRSRVPLYCQLIKITP